MFGFGEERELGKKRGLGRVRGEVRGMFGGLGEDGKGQKGDKQINIDSYFFDF